MILPLSLASLMVSPTLKCPLALTYPSGNISSRKPTPLVWIESISPLPQPPTNFLLFPHNLRLAIYSLSPPLSSQILENWPNVIFVFVPQDVVDILAHVRYLKMAMALTFLWSFWISLTEPFIYFTLFFLHSVEFQFYFWWQCAQLSDDMSQSPLPRQKTNAM